MFSVVCSQVCGAEKHHGCWFYASMRISFLNCCLRRYTPASVVPSSSDCWVSISTHYVYIHVYIIYYNIIYIYYIILYNIINITYIYMYIHVYIYIYTCM